MFVYHICWIRHTYMYTYMHMHTYMHACMHAHKHLHALSFAFSKSCVDTFRCTYAHVACICICICVYIYIYIQTYWCTTDFMFIYIYIYIYIYIHIYIYMYIYIRLTYCCAFRFVPVLACSMCLLAYFASPALSRRLFQIWGLSYFEWSCMCRWANVWPVILCLAGAGRLFGMCAMRMCIDTYSGTDKHVHELEHM